MSYKNKFQSFSRASHRKPKWIHLKAPTNAEQQAVLILYVLKQEKFSIIQLMDAMRFIEKWGKHYSFNALITELSLIMDNKTVLNFN